MQVRELSLPGLFLIENAKHADARGYFSEISRTPELSQILGRSLNFVQSNLSRSASKVLRGLHFQEPHGQGKLVRCVCGAIFDVAVDVRRQSATFGQHVSVTLSEDQGSAIWIPEGFAHGFVVTKGPALVLYQCTALYAPSCAQCLNAADPVLNIPWPLPEEQWIRSAQDEAAPGLNALF